MPATSALTFQYSDNYLAYIISLSTMQYRLINTINLDLDRLYSSVID